MPSAEFWELTWYEWNLSVYRIIELQRKRKQDMELLIELERNSMALFANAHRDDKQHPEPYRGLDFYKLPHDPIETDVQLPEQDEEKFKETIKRLQRKANQKRLKGG